MRVAVVLDRSALVGYAQRRPAVAESITYVTGNEEWIVGVPAAVYLAACWELTDDEHDALRALIAQPDQTVEILPLLGPDVEQAAGLEVELRDRGLGHAIIEAHRHDVPVATLRPDVVGRALADDSIIDLGQ